MELNCKRVVVLGGTSGIGLAVAEAAGSAGATLVVASSRQANVQAALARLPAGAEGEAVDLLDEAAVRAFFGRIGSFDHLVFTAGETLQLGLLRASNSKSRHLSVVHGLSRLFTSSGGIVKVARDCRKTFQDGKIT